MESLLLQPTATAQWYTLINEAQASCAIHLEEELESYLVFLLMRFTGKPEMASSVLGLDFLNSGQEIGAHQKDLLKDVGDKCLLFAGLFPGRAKTRHVGVSYFVRLGQSAYSALSVHPTQNFSTLFKTLCEGFTPMMDVLNATRAMNDQQPIDLLDVMETWLETKSQYAYQLLCKNTLGGAPLPLSPSMLSVKKH